MPALSHFLSSVQELLTLADVNPQNHIAVKEDKHIARVIITYVPIQ
jgi:hypothetical protein